VEATYLPSSLNRHAEYVICVDEVNSVFLREPPELLGKILTVASDMDGFTQREKVYHPPAIMKGAHINSMQEYRRLYRESIDNPQAFWSDISAGFHWETPWHTLNNVNFDLDQGPIKIEWFVGGKTNLSYNCVDRHVLAGKGDRTAFIWEGNDGERSTMSYRELLEAVSRFANVLKSHGVKRGDMVTVYLPMVCELPVAMLACARIGAVHSVVFGGFSSEALSNRIVDSKSKVLITADGVMRGSKLVPFKQIADTAVTHARELGQSVEHCIIVRRLGEERAPLGEMPAGYALWDELVARASPECPVEWLDSEAPAFLLYTSGSTGKPKGIIHTTGGYMVFAAATFKHVFDHREGDVYWCTADCGWITGHSYITYGPTANCATQVRPPLPCTHALLPRRF
jgi:acetyl-CoA synthetase